MKLTWIGTAWAAIKGALSFGTTAKLSIVDYILGVVNQYIQSTETVVENITKTHASLVIVCDKLDYYSKYIPTPWMAYFTNIVDPLKALRDMLADGEICYAEIEKVVTLIKNAYENWRK